MKKTILTAFGALLLTMGAPTHATELDAIQTAITSSSYTGVEDYTLSFTMTGISSATGGNVFYLVNDNTWAIFMQVGQYAGFNVPSTNGDLTKLPTDPSDPSTNSWDWKTSSSTTSTEPTEFTVTSTDAEGWFIQGDSMSFGSLNNYQLTIEGKNEQNETILTFSNSGGTHTVTVNVATYLNATGFSLASSNSSTTIGVSGVTFSVPEPATATLSLLALAGLAARRRR